MGLYNFQKRFVPFILAGEKTHTIRAHRAHPDRPGNTVHLYSGLRTKKAKLLGRFKCVKIEEIRIAEDGHVHIDDNWLDTEERQALARRDGFEHFEAMLDFWKGRLPFEGHIIHWKQS